MLDVKSRSSGRELSGHEHAEARIVKILRS